MKTRFYILLSMTLLLLAQTSCVYDNDILCGSEDPDLLVINLNLTVPSSSTGTRSAGHGLDAGNDDENYINIDDGDYQVLLFDMDGALVEGKLSKFECEKNGVSDGMTSYTLTTQLSLSGNEAKEKLSEFKIMVLANWMSFERSNTDPEFGYPSFADYHVSDDPDPNDSYNIYKNGDNFNFTLNKPSDNLSWVPSISENKAIPMFGISGPIRLKDAQDMGKYSDNPVANIFMLRALAKIEIVDMVPDKKSANIDKVILTKYNTSGRFIPDISEDNTWNDNNIQIKKPSLPNNVEVSTDHLQFYQTTKTVRTEGATADEGKDCFVAYIPEMDFNNVAENDYPVLNVYINNTPNPIYLGTYDPGTGKVKQENGKKDLYDHLLRNHIYRYDIISVGGSELDFLVQTPWQEDPWQEESAGEWEYDDIKIQFETGKEFNWDFSNYDEETKLPKYEPGLPGDDKRTVIITQDDWLEGKFRLTSPAKAKWTISLYGNDNTLNDHFKVEVGESKELTDEDGNIVYDGEGEDKKPVYHKEWTPGGPSVSGNVGEDILFRIVPSAVNNSNDHYVARVVFTVTTFDDQIVEVNLPYYGDENYRVEGSEMPMPTLDNNGYYYVKQYYSGFKDIEDENERNGGFGNADSANND